jgi:hypothetical protein
MARDLQSLLDSGVGSDRWFHRRNQDYETRLGFYRAQVIDKRWWIVDPHNQPWLSMGICHITYTGDTDPTGYSPYGEAAQRRYGGDAKTWAAAQAKRLRRWGFNTVGAWSSEEMFHQGLAYTVMLGVSSRVQRDVWLHGDFPDVFSDRFQEAAEQAAAEQCAPRADDPNLLGYFTDNELDWNGWRRGTPLFDYFLAKEATAPGKRALVVQLQERYEGSVAELNAAWDVDLTGFDGLLQMPALDPGPDADAESVAADKDAFLRLVAETYFETCERAIRAADPNHMILGVRFAGRAEPIVVAACGHHVDILSFNNYSYEAPAERMLPIFQATLRPIMITEWSFKAMDSGLPNSKGAAIPVHTQSDRADGYERYVEGALGLPYVVGLHWFQYIDQPILGRALDGENSNYGVVDVNDEPYFTLVERMRVVNEQVIEIAKRSRRLSDPESVDDDWLPF